MLDPVLFLGIAKDDVLDFIMGKTNPHLVDIFTSGGDYLSAVRMEEQNLLGKYLTPLISFEQLMGLEENVISLLKRIAPDYPFRSENLSLFTLNAKSL